MVSRARSICSSTSAMKADFCRQSIELTKREEAREVSGIKN